MSRFTLLDNAEFRRNLWLELSAQRLILMPVVVVLLWLAMDMGKEQHQGLVWVFGSGFFVLTGLWGSRLVATAFGEEFSQKTWDSQRMSGLPASELLLGKLLGAPIYAWYGGLCCFVPLAYGLLQSDYNPMWLLWCWLLSFLMHLATAMMTLQQWQSSGRQAQGRRAGWVVLLVLLWLFGQFFVGFAALMNDAEQTHVSWWWLSISPHGHLWLALISSLVWLWIGGWRLMRRELQYHNQPWYWLAFNLYLLLYSVGFAVGSPAYGGEFGLLTLVLAGQVMVSAGLTYLLILSEGAPLIELQTAQTEWQTGQPDRALTRLPLWSLQLPYTLLLWLLAVVCGLVLMKPVPIQALIAPALAMLLFFVRDIALLFWSALQGGRQRWTGLVYLALLYGLFPALTGDFEKNGVFYPFAAKDQPLWLLAPLLQAAVMSGLAIKAYRRA
jgi:hypothetical protein